MAELPIDRMLKDADTAWRLYSIGPASTTPGLDLMGDLSCHVRALADALEKSEAEDARLRRLLSSAAAQLLKWAAESERGGWSTHQVDPMRRLAGELAVELLAPITEDQAADLKGLLGRPG
jgi:hypothetical protein